MTRPFASRFDPSEAETLENRPTPFAAFETFSAISDWIHADDRQEPITENGGLFDPREITARLPRARRRARMRGDSTVPPSQALPALRPGPSSVTDTQRMPAMERTHIDGSPFVRIGLVLFALFAVFVAAAVGLDLFMR